jgi:dipeptidyl aminopeptidase/acylaminoacyl peptidase
MSRPALIHRRSAALAVVPALAALAALAAPAEAATPGLNGRMVSAQRAPADLPGDVEDLEIMAWAPDGTSVQLTRTRTSDTQPSWSPDGRLIAFRTSRYGTRLNAHEQIMVMSADGTGTRRVSRDADPVVFSSQPAFSPDGGRIVFRSNRDTRTRIAEVYSMDLQGGDVRRLTDTPGFDERYPTLSPDGTTLLYASNRGGTWGIWAANADGSDPRVVFDGPAEDRAPAWSPDGTHIAFETWSEENVDGEVRVVAADGTGMRTVTTNPSHDEGPAWSPDGSMLAFTSERDGDSDTWIVDAAGLGEPRNLTASDRYEESPEWQPLPYAAAGHLPCGDVGRAPGEASGVVAVKAPCDTALRVAARFTADAASGTPPEKVEGFRCVPTPHTYDQVVMECDHEGAKKGVAFVWRAAS